MYKFLFFCIFSLSIISCSEKKQQQGDGAPSEKQEKLLPPKTILITSAFQEAKPEVLKSDTSRLPTIIHVTKTKINVKSCLKGGISGGLGNFTNYNTEQGLALSSVRCSYMDKMGNLWFGTPGGGVSRYDGKSFTTFTTAQGLANNQIMCIFEDESGNMWFGTGGGGVGHYDGKSFTSFTTDQGLVNNTVRCIAEDAKGNLWFGTDGGGVSCMRQSSGGGLSVSVPAHFISFTTLQGLANNQVFSIISDTSGNLWFGTNGGVSRYDGKTFTTFTTTQGLANNSVLSIASDKKGNIWFGTNGGGLSKYDGQTFTTFSAAQGLLNNQVRCITADKKGNLWVGTDGGGVFCYDGFSFLNLTTLHGLANNNVYCITLDRNENLWIGTYGGGVSRYDGNAFTFFTTDQGLSNNQVFGITGDPLGNLWFSTYGGGVDRFDGKSFTSFTTAQGLANNYVLSMAMDKEGNIWFGTLDAGLSRYNESNGTFTNYTTAQGLANNRVNAIEVDRFGTCWFGTNGGGVSRLTRQTSSGGLSESVRGTSGSFINFTTTQGLANNTINCIAEDKSGNLWFGTNGGGVSRFDSKSFTNFTTAQGLPGNVILSITVDKTGNIWFGTDGNGISFMSADNVVKLNTSANGSPDGYSVFENYSTKEGLADDVVYGIVEDKQGNIVIGTNLGFTVLKGGYNPLQKLGHGAEYYNTKTGYPVKDLNSNSMYCDNKGIIWAGSGDKLIRFDYNSIHKSPEPPAVVIQSIRIDEENISWYDLCSKYKGHCLSNSPNIFEEMNGFGRILTENERLKMCKKFADVHFDSITRFYPLPKNLQLPYVHNHITFEYTAIEPARPNLIKYQYFLEGYSKEWSSVTKKNSVTFGNIFEGTYTLKLKAQSPEGIWSEPILYTFKVLPPWYRTWWWIIIYLIIAVLIIWALLSWRTATLRKDKLKLEKTIRERTAEVLKQKQLVETKNQQITASITYAKHIQDSFLLSEDAMSTLIPYESFVFFQPKDIVSGDFYWVSSLIQKGNPVYVIVAADCTGHGVPGAFMSMMGSMLLNKIVNDNQITDPSKILMEIHHGIFNSLHREDLSSISQDGMDVSICTIDPTAKKITYAGAMNPLYVLRHPVAGKEAELEEIKSSVFSLGDKIWKSNSPIEVSFLNHEIPFEKNMTIYLFSDGYMDQYQQDGKHRFGSQRFKKLLIDSASLSLKEQKDVLIKEQETWRGGIKQLDDVLVIGIRL